MKVLIPLNVKNKNNRVYDKNSFIDLSKEYLLEGHMNFECLARPDVDLENIVGTVNNITLTDDSLTGEVSFIDRGTIFKSLFEDGCVVFRPRSIGKIDENTGRVSECRILSFNLIRSESDSFKDKT